ncbi:hypothetical protein TUM20983_03850 [Mycobacterium antarcticum]|uniref:hypothetical protein n=1 Tax=unclassified Mycolicibacterium TaxID=2636767 RepID=UPI00239FCB80|nr:MULTISPECIES: hypothetical protein [unclassified Mycolicibacterium]GLP73275.1 hypothetical protein TUM20983_03850 [Mycolicibacterium sp. TUM20983]
MESFVSVYVDMGARADDVRAAVDALPLPHGVVEANIDGEAVTDTFGCRIAVDLTGSFDEKADGLAIAREYAAGLSAAIGVPAYAFFDLLRRDYPAS